MSASTSLPVIVAIVGSSAYLAFIANRLRPRSGTRRRSSGDAGGSSGGDSSETGFWSWLGGDSDNGDSGGGDGGGD